MFIDLTLHELMDEWEAARYTGWGRSLSIHEARVVLAQLSALQTVNARLQALVDDYEARASHSQKEPT